MCWEINRNRGSPYKPEGLYKAITELKLCSAWAKHEQQDVGELLQILIGELDGEKSKAWGLFRGWQRSLKTCKRCDTTTRKDYAFTLLCLNLDSKKEEESRELGPQSGNCSGRKMDNVVDLLKMYTGKEELRRTNQVDCKTCDERQDADKNLVLLEGPKILVMQLKRFKKSARSTETGAFLESVTSTPLKS